MSFCGGTVGLIRPRGPFCTKSEKRRCLVGSLQEVFLLSFQNNISVVSSSLSFLPVLVSRGTCVFRSQIKCIMYELLTLFQCYSPVIRKVHFKDVFLKKK